VSTLVIRLMLLVRAKWESLKKHFLSHGPCFIYFVAWTRRAHSCIKLCGVGELALVGAYKYVVLHNNTWSGKVNSCGHVSS